MKRALEALLIATDTPLSEKKIAEILNMSEQDIQRHVDELNQDYQSTGRAFEVKKIAGGYQIYTLPEFASYINALIEKKSSLSKAALETLAIIAYHQPLTRGEVEKLRGVDSTWILDALLEKGLIKTCGRLQAPGRPIRYGTTKEFLRYFGINDLADLPREEEFGEKISSMFSEKKEEPVLSVPPDQPPEPSEKKEEETDVLDDSEQNL